MWSILNPIKETLIKTLYSINIDVYKDYHRVKDFYTSGTDIFIKYNRKDQEIELQIPSYYNDRIFNTNGYFNILQFHFGNKIYNIEGNYLIIDIDNIELELPKLQKNIILDDFELDVELSKLSGDIFTYLPIKYINYQSYFEIIPSEMISLIINELDYQSIIRLLNTFNITKKINWNLTSFLRFNRKMNNKEYLQEVLSINDYIASNHNYKVLHTQNSSLFFNQLEFPLGSIIDIDLLRPLNLSILHIDSIYMVLIPGEIKYLVTLEELLIINCGVKYIPRELTTLNNLKILILSNNQIRKLPIGLLGLNNLVVLSVKYNLLTKILEDSDTDWTSLTKLQKLESLDISHNNITGTIILNSKTALIYTDNHKLSIRFIQ